MFLDNKIFGQGPKSFRYLCNDDRFKINKWSCSTHPHNYYIQLLAETGLIGFFTVFLIFFTSLIVCRYLDWTFSLRKNIPTIETIEIKKKIVLKSLSSLIIKIKYSFNKIIRIKAALSPDKKINTLVAVRTDIE